MSFRYLLLPAIFLLTFCNSISAQKGSKFYGDSLKGFDEKAFAAIAQAEGLSGAAFKAYINVQKRYFIDVKYNLLNADAHAIIPPTLFKNSGGTNQILASPCNNEGFENGTLGSWTGSIATNANSSSYPTFTNGAPTGYTTTVVTPFNDTYVGSITNSPLGGSVVAVINNSVAFSGSPVIMISQSFPVTSTNYIYDFAYWAVLEDAPNHNCTSTPYMSVRVRNNGTLTACPNFSIIAPGSGGGCAGIGPLSWTQASAAGHTVQTSSGWQRYSINLSAFSGPVTIEVMVAHCSATGHFGYAYFDSNCGQFNLRVNGTQTVNMPTSNVNVQVPCASTATMVAPPGFNPYSWNGPTGASSSGTLVTSTAGIYTLNMSPVGGCAPGINRFIDLKFAPPTTVTASPATICAAGTNTVSTLSASGASSYLWSTGQTGSSINVSPLVTTIYTVTATSGTCVGVFTVQVTVNPPPILNISASQTTVCSGPSGTITLTGSGGVSYTWSPGNLLTNPVTVTPPSSNVRTTTTYTLRGLDAIGCAGTRTIDLTVDPTATITALRFSPLTGSICVGATATLLASGGTGSQYTWTPGGAIGNIVSVGPVVNTTYSALGTNPYGTCPAMSNTVQVLVDPGPSMTVAATPTITCPGITATLTANAPTAVGNLTWNPGGGLGNTFTVNPLVTTTYSVEGQNLAGCGRTVTIVKFVAPSPTIVFAPPTPTLCFGSAITLTASGGTSYTWTSPAPVVNTNTRLASPAVSTPFFVSVNNGSCTSSSSVMVTVVPNPTVTASVSPTAICLGSSATLSGTGANTWNWLPGGMTTASPVVSPTLTTTYTVTGNTAGCTNTKTVTLVVNPLPTVTVAKNPSSVCPGICATLTPSGAQTYTYLNGGPVVCPTVTTTYSVSGTNSLGCVSAKPGTVSVIVNPAPLISLSPASATICAGGTVQVTASGALAYTWAPDPFFTAIVVLSPSVTTTYTVTGVNISGCSRTRTITITVNPNPTISATAAPATICNGSSSTLTAIGANTYSWYPGPVTGNPISVTPSSTQQYTVIGLTNGCSDTTNVTVTVNPRPTIGVSTSQATVCAGSCATLTPSGASTYTYLNGGPVVCPNVTTTYSVTGTSALGCTSNSPGVITIAVNPLPNVFAVASSATVCAGTSVTLSAGNASTYTWMPVNQQGQSIVVTPLSSTTYTVYGTAGGCIGQATVTVNVIAVPVVSATASPASICRGATSILTASGANSYVWNPGGSSSNPVGVSPIATTIYTVTGTTSGCSGTRTVMVTVNPLPTITAVSNPPAICTGTCATLIPSGALTYTYLNGGPLVCPLSGTTYSISGTNGFGCVSAFPGTVFVSVNPLPTVFISPSKDSICAGSAVTMTASGAVNYTWLPINQTGSIVSVSPGSTTTYTVLGQSASGCIGQRTITIKVNPLPVVGASAAPPTICRGQTSILTATGATSYNWNPGGMTGNPVGVSPTLTTVYTVTGTLAGCIGTRTVQVTVNSLPTISVAANPTAVCPGGCSTLTPSGAVSYTFVNGGPIVCPSVTTTYSVMGTNAQGCVSGTPGVVTVIRNSNPTIFVTASQTQICAGQSVTMAAAGASTFTWFPGSLPGATVVVTPPTTTTYTVFGTAGCTGSAVVTIIVNPNPNINATANPPVICQGDSTILNASGASSYIWQPVNLPGSSVIVKPTSTTVYTVTGTSAAGCNSTRTVIVTVNPRPIVGVTASSNTICAGSCVTLTPSGATSYTFLNGGPVVCPSLTTTYSVTGANAFGCRSSAPGVVVVNVNPIPSVSVSPTSTSICFGGSLTASASGASSYVWMPGSIPGANVSLFPSVTTIYTVTGTSLGCSKTATMLVVVNPKPVVNASASPATICNGGSSILSATGANSYVWTPGPLNNSPVTVFPTSTTIYTVIGTNSFGCTDTKTVAVNVNPLPVVSISASSNSICSGTSATLTGSGASSYNWSPGSLAGPTIIVNPSTTTTYTLVGTNGFGCSNTVLFTLNVVPTPTVLVTANTPSICQGYSVALTATGANNYTWNPGGSNGNFLIDFPNTTTTYTVNGESGGCTSSKMITIVVVPLPTITASANPTSVCAGQTVSLTAFGGVTYTWLPSFNTGSLITDVPLVSTSYTVVGQAANGCPNAAIVSVNVNPIPVISVSASSASICVGSSATLIATGGNNYTWTPGPQFTNPVVVSPTSGTNYIVFGDNGTCTGSTSIFIGVNPLPVISANATPASVCAGSPVNLNASGASNYTWQPINQFGATVVDLPIASVTYTVYGEDANGCTNFAMTSVVVNPLPTLIASASATALCEGTSVTLSGSGANSYTWDPGALSGQVVTDTPLTTTIYTLSGTDGNGCVGTTTILIMVYPNPTVVVSPLNSSVCIGSGATLTATGANSFTWYPSGITGSVTVEFPTVATIYTVTGDNGGICFHTTTVAVFVNPLPANVVATVNGTITCASPTVALFGSSTETTVLYNWTGPQNYSSGSQNPIGVTAWGIYTLHVTDTITGCVATATVDVPTDGSIPLVTPVVSGSITCATATVFINAVHTTTNPGYSWTGPNGFTDITQTVSVTVAGDYTVIVRDLTSGCADTAVVTVGTHTEVTITATIIPATCTAGSSNNDGTIMVGNFGGADKFDLVAGISYTGSATYVSAVVIPTSGIITNNLANPIDTVYYSMRIFDSLGCQKDFVLKLIPVDCSLRSLGLAKSVSTPTTNADGTYEVKYTIVARNYDTGPLSQVVISENLSTTFQSPVTFTVISVTASDNSNMFANTSFDGVTQTNLTHTTSNLAGTSADTVRFTVRVTTNGFFGPFTNTVSGVCLNNINVTVTDVSTDGMEPDPDSDGDPKNNSVPTVLNLAPDLFFGLTKQGELLKLDNNTYDITYTISVHNLGNDTLVDIAVKDSLFNNAIRQPATYSIKSGPGATGALIANSGFNGNGDINLLSAGSKLAPFSVGQITFVINVTPDTVSVISNTAFGSAYNVLSDSTLSDISNSGSNPDGNGNGVWNEPDDNVPTVIVLPLAAKMGTLFIPQGFSPDGDGINDLWVIKNLPNDGDNAITIYNRWGNRVYYHANYNNQWDGHPNIAGTMGKGKLPQGTYYYVLELKNTGLKPITGFIELQYKD